MRAMSTVRYSDAMSGVEAMMWRLESDPSLSSNVGAVTLLDRAPDIDLLRHRLLGTSLRIPRLRQTVRPSPNPFVFPAWSRYDEIDLDHHLRRVALPTPRDEAALCDLATAIINDPFDRTRPLWQFTVVEGLGRGRAALIQKLHHTIADGESGIRLGLEYLDLERDAVPPPLPDSDTIERAAESHDADLAAAERVRETLAAALRIPLGVANRVGELLADPSRIPEASASAGETARGLVEQLGDTEPARSPLWTDRSVRRHLCTATAPLAETKHVSSRLGGTLNTAFVTIATHAAARYHIELGTHVDSLRTSIAVSTRTTDSGANAFSLVRALVPTSDMGIDDRFRAVREVTSAAIDGAASAPSLDSLAEFATFMPSSVLTRVARQHARTVDFATSNVPGPPVPVYAAGAKVLATYPVGPLGGVAWNLTLLSYLGRLDMGLHVDPVAVAEPERLKRLLAESVEEFIALGRTENL